MLVPPPSSEEPYTEFHMIKRREPKLLEKEGEWGGGGRGGRQSLVAAWPTDQ